jgi:CheY-like chemotaxis protein
VSKQSLLLVDGDPRSLRVLEVSLRKAGFNVTTAVNGRDALDKIGLAPPDLIISETALEEVDGFEFCKQMKQNPTWADIPFVFLTASTEIEHKIRGLELGVDDYLTKPIYIKEIVTRVRILLQKRQRAKIEEKRADKTRFAGRLSDMAVVDLIQTIEVSRKSGLIQFEGDQGKQAAIFFREGKVIDAETGPLTAEDAVYRLLTWNDGNFEVVFRTVRRRDVITMSTQGLLMEGMRRLDEWGRLQEQLPPLDSRFEVDAKELSGRLGEIPDEHNAILKLFDGRRNLLEVIDASDYGDLECLEVVAKLYFEGLLAEVPGTHTEPPAADWAPSQRRMDETPAGREELIEEVVGPAATVALDELSDVGFEESRVPRKSSRIDIAIAMADVIMPDVSADLDGGLRRAGSESDMTPIPAGPLRAAAPGAMILDEIDDYDGATPLPPPLPDRDEGSGPKRVIGSMGADTATAFGEVSGIRHRSAMEEDETPPQRELVTIQPRRASREMSSVEIAADALDEPAPRPVMPEPEEEHLPPRIAERRHAMRPTAPPWKQAKAQPRPAAAPPSPPYDEHPGNKKAVPWAIYAGAVAAAIVGGYLIFISVRGAKGEHAAVMIDAPISSRVGGGAIVVPDATELAAITVDAGAGGVADAPQVADVVDAGTRAAAIDAGAKAYAELLASAKTALDDDDLDKALALVDRSLADKRTARALIVKADILRRMSRVDDAVAAANQAIAMSAGYAPAWDMKGKILWGVRRYDEARAAYAKFLELQPTGPEAERVRGVLGSQ